MDLFYIPDLVNKKSWPILNILDLGTNYQMIELLDSKEPSLCGAPFGKLGVEPLACRSTSLWMRAWSSEAISLSGVPGLARLSSEQLVEHHGSKERSRGTEV